MAQAVVEYILQILSGVPDFLKIIVLAMAPLTEYQLAIPVAIERFHFSPAVAYLLALIGSLCLFFPLYFGLEKLREFVSKIFPLFLRPLDAFLLRAEHKMKDNYAKYGAFALFLFLVIPFPLTGIWTATTAAVVLKIPFRPAFLGILFGVLGGELVVTIVTVGVGAFIG
jgi:uncharacterized membrane protein